MASIAAKQAGSNGGLRFSRSGSVLFLKFISLNLQLRLQPAQALFRPRVAEHSAQSVIGIGDRAGQIQKRNDVKAGFGGCMVETQRVPVFPGLGDVLHKHEGNGLPLPYAGIGFNDHRQTVLPFRLHQRFRGALKGLLEQLVEIMRFEKE